MLLLIYLGVCVVGAGLLIAGGMAVRPYLSRWRTLRRFHRKLSQLDLVAMIWEQSVGTGDRQDRRYNNPT